MFCQIVGLQRGAAFDFQLFISEGCTTLQPYYRYRLILIHHPPVAQCFQFRAVENRPSYITLPGFIRIFANEFTVSHRDGCVNQFFY